MLTVCYLGLIQQLDSVAGTVVDILITEPPGEAVILAGEAVVDAGPVGILLPNKERVVEALINTMQAANIPHKLRRRSGLVLGRLGWLPTDLDTFIEVPPGRFLHGNNKQEQEIPYRYWIAKYPITNSQYARFIEAGGYRQQQNYWSKEAQYWLQENGYKQPQYWDIAIWKNPIFPTIGISWYEAKAYCKWLTTQVCMVGISTLEEQMVLPDGYVIRLPTLEEWERAARGMDGRDYPWGDDFALANANFTSENI